MYLKTIKYLVLLYFLVFGIQLFAQTDSVLNNQMRFDFGIVRDKNRHVWPLLYKHKTKEYKDLQLLFTIYRKYRSYEIPYKHSHLLPFYWYDSSASKKDLKIGTLYYPSLFRIINDTATKSKTYRFAELAPEINLLNITKSKTGLLTQNNFFFFIWSKNDVIKNKNYFIVFPFYWYYHNQYRTTNTLFPFYRYVNINDRKEKNFSFYPGLYFYKKENNTTRHSLALLFYHKKYERQGTSEYASKTVLFPLLFSNKNAAFTKFTLFPFVHFDQTKDTKWPVSNLVITPLFWHQHKNQYKRNFLFPVYYSAVSNDFKKKYFIPFVFYNRNYADTNLSVFPLFYSGKNYQNNYHTLIPFYFYNNDFINKEKTLAITPFYWQTKWGNYKSQLLFPIWYKKEFETKFDTFFMQNFIPFVFYKKSNDEISLTVFPFYSKKIDGILIKDTTTYIFPNYINYKNSSNHFSTLLPLYYSYKSSYKNLKLLLPIWMHKIKFNHYDTNYTDVLFPFYFSKTESHYKHRILFPIIWKYQSDYFKNLTVFPFYHNYQHRKYNYQLNAYSPFVWRLKTNNKNKYIVFPLVWTDKRILKYDTLKNTVIFPIYWSYKSNFYHNKVLFPVIWSYKNKERKSFTFFPLFHYDKFGKDSFAVKHLALYPIFYKTKSLGYNKTTCFPLYFAKQTKNENNKVLFPIWYNYKNKIDTTRIVFPFYLKYKSIGYKITALTPIYWHVNGPNFTKNVVFPLWWSKTDSIEKTRTLFPFIHYQDSANGYTKSFGIVPFYWYFKEKTYTSKLLFPLWFNKTETGKNAYQSNFITPCIYSYKSKTYNEFNIYPLVYSSKSTDLKSFVFAPFYFREKKFEINKISQRTMLTPFVWINKDSSQYETKNRFRILPIYWNWRSKTNGSNNNYNSYQPIASSVNFVMPLFLTYKSEMEHRKENFKMFFPVFFKIKNSNELGYNQYKLFSIAPFYLKSKDSLNKIVGITPFFWKINNVKKDQHLLWPIYNYNVQKNNTRFNIAYILYRSQQTEKMRSWNVFWPIIQQIKGSHYSYFHIAPIVWYKKSDSMNYFSIQPLLFSQKTNKFKRFQLLWQLYSYKNNFGFKTSHGFLWNAFYHSNYKNGDFETRFLYKVFAQVNKDSCTEKILFPFYNIQKQKNGDYYKAYFFNLYQKSKTQVPNTSEYYLEEKVLWYIRLRSNFNYLKQKGVINNRKFK